MTPVLLRLQEKIREEVLKEISGGETLLCSGLTEPDAGSDIWSMQTKAVQDEDEWVINGTKQWITNARYAKCVMTFTITDLEQAKERKGGISCCLVPIDGKTVNPTSTIPALGHLGSATAIISFENARVHQKYIIGDLHQGFGKALKGVDLGRVVVVALCVGGCTIGIEHCSQLYE